jgi:hypothetical protein
MDLNINRVLNINYFGIIIGIHKLLIIYIFS